LPKLASHEHEESDDEIGPALPGHDPRRAGPAVPSLQDLEMRDGMSNIFLHDIYTQILTPATEQLAEEAHYAREDQRYYRKQERKQQKELLDELAPRPDAGTYARRLENKAAKTLTLRSFADDKTAGMEDVGEGDLMGGGDDEYKRQLKETEKKRSEREIRKEEVLRARAAEREERLRGMREKEEKTMSRLRGLVRERFG